VMWVSQGEDVIVSPAALSCDFLPVGPTYGAGKAICDLGRTRGDEESASPVAVDALEGAFDCGDPCEASVLTLSVPITSSL